MWHASAKRPNQNLESLLGHRLYTAGEFGAHVERAGFASVELFGGLDGRPCRAEDDKLVVVAGRHGPTRGWIGATRLDRGGASMSERGDRRGHPLLESIGAVLSGVVRLFFMWMAFLIGLFVLLAVVRIML